MLVHFEKYKLIARIGFMGSHDFDDGIIFNLEPKNTIKMNSLPNFITFFLVIVFPVIKILFIRRKNKLIFRAGERASKKK